MDPKEEPKTDKARMAEAEDMRRLKWGKQRSVEWLKFNPETMEPEEKDEDTNILRVHPFSRTRLYKPNGLRERRRRVHQMMSRKYG